MGNRRNPPDEKDERKAVGRRRAQALIPGVPSLSQIPSGYSEALEAIKGRVQTVRLRTVLAANSAMVLLYWDIGKTILEQQQRAGWGSGVIDRLSKDLREAFPEVRGFSPRNLKYMRAFASAWPDRSIVQEALAQIPWLHNLTLLEKLTESTDRLWYARRARQEGWSQSVMMLQIERQTHNRQGKALTNFPATLPPADSDSAIQIFKDPYLFDFLGTADLRREKEIEQSLVDHIQRFLLELGTGFAFVGRQVLLEVGDQDFLVDLLFYHLKLRCFVVIEFKVGAFDPSFVGQMNLYLSAVDDLLRQPDDKPSIGLLLCRSKNKIVVEYALRGLKKPLGVAQWETQIVGTLPADLRSSLPTVEELEAELERGE